MQAISMGGYLLAFIAMLASPRTCQSQNHPKYLISYLGCLGASDERSLRFDANFFLYEDFLRPESGLEPQLRAAAIQHVYYLRANLSTQQRQGNPLQLAWSPDQPEISINAVSRVGYPMDLAIDASYDPHVKITQPYLTAAIAAGRAIRGGRALKVSYSVNWRVAVCAGPGRKIGSFTVALPFDPYLAYWSVKPGDRRRRNDDAYRGVVNPCVDPTFIDYPDPYYLWYFWRIDESGMDDDRSYFSCKDLLQPGRDFYYFSANLAPGVSSRGKGDVFRIDRISIARPLEVSAIFGILDANRPFLPFNTLMEFVASKGAISLPVLKTWIEDSFPVSSRNDSGAEYFRDFVNGLPDRLVLGSEKIKADSATGTLGLSGRLRLSGKPIRLSLFFGPTDLLAAKEVRHWRSFLAFLERGDILIYMGHAGLGENMKIANLLQSLGLSEDQLRQKLRFAPAYQLLVYFSCFSYSYFGDDAAAYRRSFQPGSITDILDTGMDYGSGAGGLAILRYVDRYAAHARNFNPRTLADRDHIDEDEFFIVRSFE